jgi:uncharacterized protein YbjT (DUF2867 family)
MNKKTVIVAGSSGLVGSEAVKLLLDDSSYEEVILLVRKKSEINHPKVKEILFNFNSSEYHIENIQADSMFICIGTTMKKAQTKEAFKEVDLNIPVKLAKLAKKLSVRKVSVISAMGAELHSSFFYNRVKGELETQIISLNLPSVILIRPSLLIGHREEIRFGERVAEKVYKVLPFIYPKKYQPIEASRVALAMIKADSDTDNLKVTIIENSMIHELSRNS